MPNAKITVRERDDDTWLDRLLGWNWWWCARVSTETRHGFARTRDAAIARAETAARDLADQQTRRPARDFETWSIDVPTTDTPAEPTPPADDLHAGFWPGIRGGLCPDCHLANNRGGYVHPDHPECLAIWRHNENTPATTKEAP